VIPNHQDCWINQNYVTEIIPQHRNSQHHDYKTMNAWTFHHDSIIHNIHTTRQ